MPFREGPLGFFLFFIEPCGENEHHVVEDSISHPQPALSASITFQILLHNVLHGLYCPFPDADPKMSRRTRALISLEHSRVGMPLRKLWMLRIKRSQEKKNEFNVLGYSLQTHLSCDLCGLRHQGWMEWKAEVCPKGTITLVVPAAPCLV